MVCGEDDSVCDDEVRILVEENRGDCVGVRRR